MYFSCTVMSLRFSLSLLPDISDSELEEKLSTIQEETPEPEAPASPLLSALRSD